MLKYYILINIISLTIVNWGHYMKKTAYLIIIITIFIPLLAVNVSANEPPSLPIIEGPTRIKEGETITYSFVSTDPEGDDISYCIKWGDDTPEICLGPFNSGLEQSNTHSFVEGEYTIRIKARDTNGAESDWAYLEIRVPKNNIILNNIIKLFQNNPMLSLIIQKILRY
jgi:hypothetical protein